MNDLCLFSEQELDFGGISQIICHLAGLQGFSCYAWDQNPPLWSLGYEWALYLFAPAIIQLIVWKASFGLRLTGIVLACAIAATICTHPEKAVFWFSVWFLGAGSYHLLRAGLLSLPFGLLGAGLIIGGMAIAWLKSGSGLAAETAIAAGTALVIACRPMVEFRFASRFFSWAAGFSYTLYAIHIPIVFLVVAIFQNLGFPRDKVPPSTRPLRNLGLRSPYVFWWPSSFRS